MNHLDRYLYEVNSYPKFKRKRKFFDRFLIKFAGVSFLLLCLKFLVEFVLESI